MLVGVHAMVPLLVTVPVQQTRYPAVLSVYPPLTVRLE